MGYFSKTTLGSVRQRGERISVLYSIHGLPAKRHVITGGSIALAMLFNGGKLSAEQRKEADIAEYVSDYIYFATLTEVEYPKFETIRPAARRVELA